MSTEDHKCAKCNYPLESDFCTSCGERQSETPIPEFKNCVDYRRDEWGRHVYDCKLGLWGVSGDDHERVLREAVHYFSQYAADGEYDGKEENMRTL